MKSCLQEENIQPNNATLVTTNGCPHENNILTKEIRWAIQTIVALITCQWNSVQQPVVLYCCNIQNPHICFTDGFLCLSCVYLVCREESHVSEHYKFSGHSVYFDMSFMKIYCCRCKAYLADHLSSYIISKLDWSMRMTQGEERTGGFQLSSLPPSMKRNLEWIPSPQELEWIKAYSVSVDSEESKVFPYPGLCGLLNLGNSCYMNAILQVMLHTVPLKRYFLSDTHRCHCPRNIQQCAACALDDLLIKGYHESLERDLSEREPLSPQYILEIIWRHCDSLASYAQHDAHEFFITFVNVLRQHMMTGMNKEEPTPYSRNILSKQPNKEQEEEARGWLDDLFSGVLESHVYCASCKRYSATLEDYFDISLDLNSSEDSDGTRTLQECLTWFTSPEELDNGTSRYCEYCQQHTSFYKRVAFHKLPQVLCFHLKRFQHGLDGKGVSSKVESEIGFPIHGLDMSPYISSQILEETRVVEDTLEDGIATKKPPQDDDDDEEQQRVLSKEDMLYDLYAVVNHIGKIDHGHYITWIREQNSSWFKCDDEVVEESLWTKDNVAQSCQAYLLFYIARNVA